MERGGDAPSGRSNRPPATPTRRGPDTTTNYNRDAATKAPGGTNPSEDPTLRSSLQGLATRILADALNTAPGENGAEGADTAVREPSSEATMRRDNTKAFAGSMTRVNARGAVLPGHVGRVGASTASSRARSATPSPERGRPGWRPNGAAAPSVHIAHRSRTASPDVRACATAADKLVAAVSRQRERRAAARGLVFKDTTEQTRNILPNSSIAVQTDDDEAEEEEAMTTTIDATLSESEDDGGDGLDANAGILREFASGVQAVANEAAQQATRVGSDDVDQCGTDVWRAANSFARELRGVSASAAPIVAERLARSETDKRTFQLQVQEMKKRLETAVTFASEVRDVCAVRDAELAEKNAELSEARTALAAAAAGKLAAMLEPDSTSTDSNSNPQLAAEIAAAAKLAVVELEEELRATRSAHTEGEGGARAGNRCGTSQSFRGAEESHQKTAHSLTKERDAARAALRDAEMETQEALSDVARLQKALAESKDANKSAADVAEAESKIVDELRGKLQSLETAKETLELKLKTAGAEANGEADMRADASADKRAARDDLATAKETIESLRHELDAAAAARDKAERAKAEVNGKLFELTAEADGLRKRLGKAKEECEAQRNAAEAARRRAKASSSSRGAVAIGARRVEGERG